MFLAERLPHRSRPKRIFWQRTGGWGPLRQTIFFARRLALASSLGRGDERGHPVGSISCGSARSASIQLGQPMTKSAEAPWMPAELKRWNSSPPGPFSQSKAIQMTTSFVPAGNA